METRNVTITLDKAREWYKSGNASLKEIALQAFDKDELTYNFKDITTFKKACEVLNLNYADMACLARVIAKTSRASAAMFKLNIIRKALNLGQDLYFTKNPKDSCIYHPHNLFVFKNSTYFRNELESGSMEIIGEIRIEGKEYKVLGGRVECGIYAGLGNFYSIDGFGGAYPNTGFLGCASIEIARHFGKYFGMLITKAKYGDMVDFEIVQDKYHNC